MGAHSFPLSSSLSSTSTPLSITVHTHVNPSSPIPIPVPILFRSIKVIPNVAPRHRTKNHETFKSGRSKFSIDDDELFTDGENEFGFGGGAKQRVWWSDEMMDVGDQYDDDDDEEFWIIKVLKAFGWMVPAVGLSMLLGTGTNTLFMAIALPLGQSVLSFAMDIVRGKPRKRRTRPRTQSRTKRKPSTKNARNYTANEARREEESVRSRQKQASRTTIARTAKNGNKSSSSKYGGWDELVNERIDQQKYRTTVPIQNIDELGTETETGKGKLIRRGRNRETPLFVRLLIAVFPFLGSWTKLM